MDGGAAAAFGRPGCWMRWIEGARGSCCGPRSPGADGGGRGARTCCRPSPIGGRGAGAPGGRRGASCMTIVWSWFGRWLGRSGLTDDGTGTGARAGGGTAARTAAGGGAPPAAGRGVGARAGAPGRRGGSKAAGRDMICVGSSSCALGSCGRGFLRSPPPPSFRFMAESECTGRTRAVQSLLQQKRRSTDLSGSRAPESAVAAGERSGDPGATNADARSPMPPRDSEGSVRPWGSLRWAA